jgi:long-chain-acyl-CoA dehydrogenase
LWLRFGNNRAAFDAEPKTHAGTLTAVNAAQGQALDHRGQHRVLDRCPQLPGGYNYMTEYPIARPHADAPGQTMYGGTSEIMKTIIARDVTGLRT